MEGLNLGDLNFDESSLGLFDEATGEQDSTNADTPAAEKPATETTVVDEKNTNTDGDDSANASQESVADQSKDDNDQVQAGKTADGEGSDSSSPKLNETEQLYSNLAAQFKSNGVLPGLDVSQIKSLEDIETAIKSRIDSGLTDRQKFIEEAQKSGAPVGKVSELHNTIEKLESVTPEFIQDEENIEFRRNAIIQDALTKGYTEERASTMAQRSIDAGTDVEDAEFALSSLIESEKSSLSSLIEEAKNTEKESLNNIKNYISTTPEVIPGFVLTDSQKDELYNQITTDLGDRDNAFMKAQKEDPVGSRIKLEAIFLLTKGLKDFSIFGSKTETKISNNLENLIRGAKFTDSGTVDTNVSDSQSNFKLSDLKDLEIE
jgi:hypothetical protein